MWKAKIENDTTTFKELAVAAGLSEATATKRMQRFRIVFRTRWAELITGPSLMVACLVLLLCVPCVPAGLTMVMSGHTNPNLTVPLPALESAGELRTRGHAACEAGKYPACVRLLDRAKLIDPEGDAKPEVVKAREVAKAALRGDHQ
jgi:hypothetical protein